MRGFKYKLIRGFVSSSNKNLGVDNVEVENNDNEMKDDKQLDLECHKINRSIDLQIVIIRKMLETEVMKNVDNSDPDYNFGSQDIKLKVKTLIRTM